MKNDAGRVLRVAMFLAFGWSPRPSRWDKSDFGCPTLSRSLRKGGRRARTLQAAKLISMEEP
jgi:hypothetical protein